MSERNGAGGGEFPACGPPSLLGHPVACTMSLLPVVNAMVWTIIIAGSVEARDPGFDHDFIAELVLSASPSTFAQKVIAR